MVQDRVGEDRPVRPDPLALIAFEAAAVQAVAALEVADAALGAGSVALGLGLKPAQARAEGDPENVLTEALVLREADIPVAGNPDGDITIVEYFDYNCPYCRKLEPELRQVVFDDGKVRLIWKDWPILGPV